MSIKKSLEENKDFILESLPTKEAKEAFTSSLKSMEEPTAPSIEQIIHEAQSPEYVSPDLYDALKNEIENRPVHTPLTEEEAQEAMNQELVRVDTTPKEEEEVVQQEDAEAITDYGDSEEKGEE